MLSGITSQLGGLMGRGNKEETSNTTEDSSNNKEEDTSKQKSRSGSASEGPTSPSATTTATPTSSATSTMLGNLTSVRSQLPSWLGGGKNDPAAATAVEGEEASGATASSTTTTATNKTDEEETPTAEGEAASGANLDKVKNLGYQIFSSIKGAGQKIKDQNPLQEFLTEQNNFLKASKVKGGEVSPPWVGHVKEEELKEEVLGLSGDRRNFVRSPPTGVSFPWDYEEMLPVAKAILKEDPNLEKMRYDLVPKVISEENFWRNYFYRVMLLRESLDATTKKKQDSIETDSEGEDADKELEKELNEELKSFEVVEKSSSRSKSSKLEEKEIDSLLDLK